MIVSLTLISILNYEILLPNLFQRKKSLFYLFSILLLLFLFLGIIGFINFKIKAIDNNSISGVEKWIENISLLKFIKVFQIKYSLYYIIFICFSSILFYVGLYKQKEIEAIQLSKEKLKAELKFLKSQINPHFLFNSLNNIYSTILENPSIGAESLLKLSYMLRYILYESKENKVEISKDIEYIKSFIHLQIIKDDSIERKIKTYFSISKNIEVEPMLFIPFIENAFKHGVIDDYEEGFIDLSLVVDDRMILFQIENSLPNQKTKKYSVGGIGIENVTKRLEILYNKNFQLEIEKLEKTYKIELKINL
ncbi:MAG: histidine kinase [Marinifilaceae bacterium]|jgi:LytS/YehU family sensor histidine kinase|nr:histidine kinase [Marinifilaceae bacterium]